MNAKEAKETVELHKHLEEPISDKRLHSDLDRVVHSYLKAKGYLEALRGEEVTQMLEALRESNCKCHPPMDYVCKRCEFLKKYAEVQK